MEELLRLGLVELASVELDRLSALSPTAPSIAPGRLALARELARRGRPGEATRQLAELAHHTPPATDAQGLHLALGELYLSAGEADLAQLEFARVEVFSPSEVHRAQAAVMGCFTQVLLLAPERARGCAERVGLWAGLTAQERLRSEQLLEELEAPSPWRVRGVMALSMGVPGLGQAVSGQLGDGLNAAGVHAAWLTWAGALLRAGRPLEAAAITVGVGGRFYVQNLRSAREAAHLKAHQARQSAAWELLALWRESVARATRP